MKLLRLFGLGRVDASLLSIQHVYDGVQRGSHVIIDVRTPQEWNDGIALGSVMISLQDAAFIDKIFHLASRDKILVISCKSGIRSKIAVKKLIKAGLTNIYIMKGGFDAWTKQGLPCDTLKVSVVR